MKADSTIAIIAAACARTGLFQGADEALDARLLAQAKVAR